MVMLLIQGINGESVDNGSQSTDKSLQLYHSIHTSQKRVTYRTIKTLNISFPSRETILKAQFFEMTQQIWYLTFSLV